MLGVELVDFFIFPEKDKRHKIMALLADCPEETLDAVLRRLARNGKTKSPEAE